MEHLGREGRRAEQILGLLASLDNVCDGGEISELAHALQVATRAERAGADDELVLAALLHDIGKVFGAAGHAQISAEVIAPHVRSEVVEVVRHHGAFTARHWDQIGPEYFDPRDKFGEQSWFDLAAKFVDEWDMQSFDPDYDFHTLEYFGATRASTRQGPVDRPPTPAEWRASAPHVPIAADCRERDRSTVLALAAPGRGDEPTPETVARRSAVLHAQSRVGAARNT